MKILQTNIFIQQSVCVIYAFRDIWNEWGDSNFQIFTELKVPPQAAGVVGKLNCVFSQYHSYSKHHGIYYLSLLVVNP